MSGVRFRDSMVYVLAGAGLLMLLSACQTSRHTEVMGAKDLQDEMAITEAFSEAFSEQDRKDDEQSMLEDQLAGGRGLSEGELSEEEMGRMSAFGDGSAQDLLSSDIMAGRHMGGMDPTKMTDRERMEQDGTNFGLSDVFFGYDKYGIDDEASYVLKANARVLKDQYKNAGVLIEGHCDERGTLEYNLELGKRRAQNIKNYLIDLGVKESNIRIVSYGKERPFCMTSEPVCWAQNRRGHFLLQR